MKAGVALTVAVACVTCVACFSIDGPPGGITSISAVVAPSPSVVVNDVMRDSAGNPAALRVFAFDESGDTIQTLEPSFVVLDPGLTIDDTGLVHGDSVRPNGPRVVATVGPLQTTSQFTIPVSVLPTHVTRTLAGDSTLLIGSVDSLGNRSPALSLRIAGEPAPDAAPADTGAVGFIVRYEVLFDVQGRDANPVLYVGTADGKPSARDTTDAAGTVSRVLVFRLDRATDSLKTALVEGGAVLNVPVRASVVTRGYTLTPDTVRFTVPVKFPGFESEARAPLP